MDDVTVTLASIDLVLNSLRRRVSATSCTCYIKDPVWGHGFHLVAMPGVTMPEPMHGFLTAKTLEHLASSDDRYVADVANERGFRDPFDVPPKIAPNLNRLYGDFVEREKVRSVERRVFKRGDEVTAVLHLNFSERVPARRHRLDIDKTFRSITARLDAISAEIVSNEAAFSLKEIVSVLRPARTVANMDSANLDLHSIAALALNSVGLREDSGLATIHLYDSANRVLELKGQCGHLDSRKSIERLSIDGPGLIVWAARRRSALLIPDLKRSRFRALYIKANRNTIGELVVPILGGDNNDDLIGVLNIESYSKNHFTPRLVKSVWYAANKVAVANRMWRERQRYERLNKFSRELLGFCWEATDGSESRVNSLRRVAKLVNDSLSADDCDIWLWDEHLKEFQRSGSTFKLIDQPRAGGWTEKIVRTLHRPLWLVNRGKHRRPQARIWTDGKWVDFAPTKDDPIPRLHPKVEQFKGHLGIPIKVNERTCGVAWIRYLASDVEPTSDQMDWARGLAGHVGLISECITKHGEVIDSNAIKTIGAKVTTTLLGQRELHELAQIRQPLLEGFVAYRPYRANLGGDCYRVVTFDENACGVFLGDGENHAVAGALNMLPLLAAFDASPELARFPPAILDKLHRTAERLGVVGTAICAVINRHFERGKPVVTMVASSSGHPPAILNRGADMTAFPTDPHALGGACGLVPAPTNSQSTTLDDGDILIFYTDGVSDALSWSPSAGGHQPTDRDARLKIEEIAIRHREDGPKAIAEAIIHETVTKMASYPDPDDATLMVVRVINRAKAGTTVTT